MPLLDSLRWGWFLALLSVMGAMTFLFPLLAAFVSLFTHQNKSSRSGTEKTSEPLLEILIPAYNEEDTIVPTIQSIFKSAQKWIGTRPGTTLKITVALDGSKDKTRDRIRELIEAHQSSHSQRGIQLVLLDRAQNLGKWETLRELSSQSRATWSAFVDAGTLWPEEMISELEPLMRNAKCVGIAPGYRPIRSTLLEKLVWWQERSLKQMENWSGGPFSLHGATMIFRSTELKDAFNSLGTRKWLNDDVVLGLALRLRGAVKYLGASICVFDSGIRSGASETNRRKRLVLGNIEWIQQLFPSAALQSPALGLLALRRISRIFWAYGLLACAFCFFMFCNIHWAWCVPAAGILLLAALLNRRLREAAWVSLKSPLLILAKNRTYSWA